ncbi:MAG: D-alanine--D-alanine ligase [Clostridiales bacterium]|jgi:D-alanine-D-alanine ligase|nr:D-alanine--D-alanine ligase [Clostridiales bacterium]
MNKKTIVVLFGGQSSEHDVSCVSATTVINNIDINKYNVVKVGITKEGKWLLHEGTTEQMKNGEWKNSSIEAIISPNAVNKEVILNESGIFTTMKIDMVYPVLHGLYGEDGTVQGLLELAKIPYVGCGVLSSSVSMDKLYTKIIVDTLNIRQAKYVGVRKDELVHIERVIEEIEAKLQYPVFVKPANAGSSVGVTKAHNQEELVKGLNVAALHDRKILVEETIVGREIECAILGGYNPEASVLGEVLAAAEFYDYDAKYNNVESKTVINPEMDSDVIEKVRSAAIDIFRAVDGYGESRVDFFVEKDTNEVVFNEINTLPGFTGISMYPMLWSASGVDIKELVDRLIDLAFERNA